MSKRAVELDAASAIHGQVSASLKTGKAIKKAVSKKASSSKKETAEKKESSPSKGREEESSKEERYEGKEEPQYVKSERLDKDEPNTPSKKPGHIAISAPAKPKRVAKSAPSKEGKWKQSTLPGLYNTRQFKDVNGQ